MTTYDKSFDRILQQYTSISDLKYYYNTLIILHTNQTIFEQKKTAYRIKKVKAKLTQLKINLKQNGN